MNIILVHQSSHLSASASAQELLTSDVYFYPSHFLSSGIELLPTGSSFTIPLQTFSTSLCKDQESTLGTSLNFCKGLNSPRFSEVQFSSMFSFLPNNCIINWDSLLLLLLFNSHHERLAVK